MKLFRLLLYPFSLLYGLIVILRNLAYNYKIFKSEEFSIPIISVGNLTVGGSGKSPMTEYLVRLLRDEYRVAILSRGYGRKSKGFIRLSSEHNSREAGDEPTQFKRKFPDITVAVSENRAFGIRNLIYEHSLIILDDAFQHRAVKPGFSILLFDYQRLDDLRMLLPSGNLREPWAGRVRADIFIVSKCPFNPGPLQRNAIINRLSPFMHQHVFFSGVKYNAICALNGQESIELESLGNYQVILLTGIARPETMLDFLIPLCKNVIHQNYPDHHHFSRKNILKLAESYQSLDPDQRIIITTEKDARRLDNPEFGEILNTLPVYYLPMQVEIFGQDKEKLELLIRNYAEGTIYND